LITQFLVVSNIARVADFYIRVLDARPVLDGDPTILRVANTWLWRSAGTCATPTGASSRSANSPPPDEGPGRSAQRRVGDLATACLAVVTIVALHRRMEAGRRLAWVTAVMLFWQLYTRRHEPLVGSAGAVLRERGLTTGAGCSVAIDMSWSRR
jgi:hypothetical protein